MPSDIRPHLTTIRVLCNVSILRRVLNEFDPWNDASLTEIDVRARKNQLFNLASTCRVVSMFALEVLWSCLESLLPLIKTIPNLQIINNAYYVFGSIPISSSFRQYASRVRVLRLGPYPSDAPKLSPQLAIVMAQDLRGQVLFPLVRCLTVDIAGNTQEANDNIASLPLLVSQYTTSICFGGKGLYCGLFSNFALPYIAQRCPGLTALTIKGSIKFHGANGLRPVAQMTNLRALELCLSDSRGFKSSYLPDILRPLVHLVSLTLDVHFDRHQDTDSCNSSDPHALVLKGLSIQNVLVVSRNSDDPTTLCPCVPLYLFEMAQNSIILRLEEASIDNRRYFRCLLERCAKNPHLPFVELHVAGTTNPSNLSCFHNVASLRSRLLFFKFPLATYNTTDPLNSRIIDAAFGHLAVTQPTALKGIALIKVTWSCLARVSRLGVGLERLHFTTSADFFTALPSGHKTLEDWLDELRKSKPASPSKLQFLAIGFDDNLFPVGMTIKDATTRAKLLDFLFPELVCLAPLVYAQNTIPSWTDHWAPIEALRKMYQNDRRRATMV